MLRLSDKIKSFFYQRIISFHICWHKQKNEKSHEDSFWWEIAERIFFVFRKISRFQIDLHSKNRKRLNFLFTLWKNWRVNRTIFLSSWPWRNVRVPMRIKFEMIDGWWKRHLKFYEFIDFDFGDIYPSEGEPIVWLVFDDAPFWSLQNDKNGWMNEFHWRPQHHSRSVRKKAKKISKSLSLVFL